MLLEWYRLILCLSAPSHHTSRNTLYFRGEVEAVDSSVEKVSHRKNPVIVYCAANFGTTMLCIFTSLPLLFHAYVIREHWWRKVWWYNERKPRVYSCACCDGCFSGFWKSQAPVPTLSYYIAWQPLNVGSDRIKNDEKCATTPMLCNCTCWYYLLHTLVIYPAIKTFLFPFLPHRTFCSLTRWSTSKNTSRATGARMRPKRLLPLCANKPTRTRKPRSKALWPSQLR